MGTSEAWLDTGYSKYERKKSVSRYKPMDESGINAILQQINAQNKGKDERWQQFVTRISRRYIYDEGYDLSDLAKSVESILRKLKKQPIGEIAITFAKICDDAIKSGAMTQSEINKLKGVYVDRINIILATMHVHQTRDASFDN